MADLSTPGINYSLYFSNVNTAGEMSNLIRLPEYIHSYVNAALQGKSLFYLTMAVRPKVDNYIEVYGTKGIRTVTGLK